jgi:hypothetical protein
VKTHDELVAELLAMYPDAQVEVPIEIHEGANGGRYRRTSNGFIDIVLRLPGVQHPDCETVALVEVKSVHERCSAGDIVRQLYRYATGWKDAPHCRDHNYETCRKCNEGEHPWNCAASKVQRAECDASNVILALYTDRVLTAAEILILERADVTIL